MRRCCLIHRKNNSTCSWLLSAETSLANEPDKVARWWRGEEEVVGQENEPRVFLGIEVVNPSQGIGIQSSRFWSREQDGLVGPQAQSGIDGSRATVVELRVLFGAGDKEGIRLREEIEAGEIQVAPIEQSSPTEKAFATSIPPPSICASRCSRGHNSGGTKV